MGGGGGGQVTSVVKAARNSKPGMMIDMTRPAEAYTLRGGIKPETLY